MITNTAKPVLAAIALAIATAGCEQNGTSPKDSPPGRGSDKFPQALTNECVNVFTGIENCSINGTTITGDPAAQTVTVTNFAPDGGSGVSGSFEDAAAWFQDADADLGANGAISFSASSEGQILGRLDVTANANGTNNVWATFSGEDGGDSRYSVTVFNGDEYVGGQTGVPPGDENGALYWAPAGQGTIHPGTGFGNISRVYGGPGNPPDITPYPWQEGACEWSLRSAPGSVITVRLPNGTELSGTKVLFTEEVTPGHVVYSRFQRVDVQGTMNRYTITSESILAAE